MLILYQIKDFFEYLLSALIRISKSDYAIVFFTSFITAYLSHYFISQREKNVTAQNQIAEISGLLYLTRMTLYQRYEAELYSNYYEKRGEINKTKVNFDKEREELQNNIMRKKSEEIYELYKELHSGITKLRQVKKLSKSLEEKFNETLNYKTLVFKKDYKKIRSVKELEEYKEAGLKEIKKYIKELKDFHLFISNLQY
jgi:ribosomal protein L7/L12